MLITDRYNNDDSQLAQRTYLRQEGCCLLVHFHQCANQVMTNWDAAKAFSLQAEKAIWLILCMQMGAMMNESFQAKEGLPPDLFPEGVPTYTGHYHKPHTVADTNIRYIGSPYQGTCCVWQ